MMVNDNKVTFERISLTQTSLTTTVYIHSHCTSPYTGNNGIDINHLAQRAGHLFRIQLGYQFSSQMIL